MRSSRSIRIEGAIAAICIVGVVLFIGASIARGAFILCPDVGSVDLTAKFNPPPDCDLYEGQEWILDPHWAGPDWDCVLPADGCNGPPAKLSHYVKPPSLEFPCTVSIHNDPGVCACMRGEALAYALNVQDRWNLLRNQMCGVPWCSVGDILGAYEKDLALLHIEALAGCGNCIFDE